MTKRFGPLAQQAREARSYKQTDVDRLLGFSKGRLSRIENGKQAVSLNDYLSFAILFSSEFSIRSSEIVADLKADIYSRLSELLEAEDTENPRSFKRLSNLKALHTDLELLHG